VINIIQTYKKVLAIDPKNIIAFFNLGIAYYFDEKLEEAKGFFQRAIALGNHLDSHLYLGVIYAQQDEKDKAIHHLRVRIRYRSGSDDTYAEEARKLLYDLIHEDEMVNISN
jgi:tetratricopeptide (TPR) repeat protein